MNSLLFFIPLFRKKGGGASPYQQWAGYPESSELTADYPHQFIARKYYQSSVELYISTVPLYRVGGGSLYDDIQTVDGTANIRVYQIVENVWTWTGSPVSKARVDKGHIYEANTDIYTTTAMTTIFFAKTTE